MSKAFSIESKGIKNVVNRIKAYPEKIKTEVDGIMAEESLGMAAKNVNDAPVDESFLRQSISSERKGEMHYNVSASIGYAPFIEFGTKRKFRNPYPTIDPSQFKGKGGSANGKGFYDEILAWVRRKGFASTKTKSGARSRSLDSRIAEEQAAYAIYVHILRHGTKPHPFFFKHYFTATQNIIKKVRAVIKKK